MSCILYSREDNLRKYVRHKDLFSIASTPHLEMFDRFLSSQDDAFLECSVKIVGDSVFPARFNIYFQDNKEKHAENINKVLAFFSELCKVGANIDLRMLKEIFSSSMDSDKLRRIVVGIDLRERLSDCRAKIWMIIQRYPDMVNKLLEMHGNVEHFSELIWGSDMLFGIDFYFDGRSKLKIYPEFNTGHIENKIMRSRLEKIFSKAVMELVLQSRMFNVSFDDVNLVRILHFHPKNTERFAKCINNRKLNDVLDMIKLSEGVHSVFSMGEDEIKIAQIKKVNCYY